MDILKWILKFRVPITIKMLQMLIKPKLKIILMMWLCNKTFKSKYREQLKIMLTKLMKNK